MSNDLLRYCGIGVTKMAEDFKQLMSKTESMDILRVVSVTPKRTLGELISGMFDSRNSFRYSFRIPSEISLQFARPTAAELKAWGISRQSRRREHREKYAESL